MPESCLPSSFQKDEPLTEKVAAGLLCVCDRYRCGGNLSRARAEILSILELANPVSLRNFFRLEKLFDDHLHGRIKPEYLKVLESAVLSREIRELLVFCGWWFDALYFEHNSDLPFEPLAELCFLRDCLTDPQMAERHFDMYALAEAKADPEKLKTLDHYLESRVGSGQLTTTQARHEREKAIFSGKLLRNQEL